MVFFRKDSIEILVRHAIFSDISKHKKRPSYFNRKRSYENLLATIDPSFKVTFFLDLYHGSLQEHFLSKEKKHPVITFKEGTESGAFLYLLEYIAALDVSDNPIIYIVEDDYIHRKGWGKILLDAFSLPQIDYATLYDHKDKYTFSQYEELRSKIFAGKYSHFRTTPSTTNTFAARLATFKEDLSIHRRYSEGRKISADHEKCLALQEKGRILVSAIPGWSTHAERDFLSPCIDWKKELTQTLVPKKSLLKKLFFAKKGSAS